MGKTRRCYLCNRKENNEAPYALHKFPKDKVTADLWKINCNLRTEDNVSNLRICSFHFKRNECIGWTPRQVGSRLCLQMGAVPSLFTKADIKKEYEFASHQKQEILELPAHTDSCTLRGVAETVQHMDQISGVAETVQHMDQISGVAETVQRVDETSSEIETVQYLDETTGIIETVQRVVNKEVHVPSGSDCEIHIPGMKREFFNDIEEVNNIRVETNLKDAEEAGPSTPKHRELAEPRYIGDLAFSHVQTPRRAKRTFHMIKNTFQRKTHQLKIAQQQIERLKKRIRSMEELIQHLRRNNMLSEDATATLMEGLPTSLKALLLRNMNGAKREKFSPDLRSFALTLNFYSPRAYKYVRRMWGNVLPHPGTIKKWYKAIDGKPGFTEEALRVIKLYASNETEVIHCNLVLDEMSIRKQIVFNNGKFYGSVDLGTGLQNQCDNAVEARSALVFMIVALNRSWKVPIGYFLINNLCAQERANLLVTALELIHECDVKVLSITFDGAPVNLNMCIQLGANFSYFTPGFQPFFNNPVTNEKIFIFLDACHMIKLVRNTLGDKKVLKDANDKIINWQYIAQLHNLQSTEGLHAATKLSKKHIFYNDNRMNVQLAVQTLSTSVYNALTFASQIGIEEFKDCLATANFCLIFNHIFDVLNCRSKFSKKNDYCRPLNNETVDFLRQKTEIFIKYIESLKDDHGVLLLQTNRKTGFIGLIICLKNLFSLFDTVKITGQAYILSFRLSQDMLETFFSAIRSRGGFNNNPNSLQFQTAYKHLLIKHEITSSGNCLSDDIKILHVTSKPANYSDPICDYTEEIIISAQDHDYIQTVWKFSPYLDNVINYIAGFVAKKILEKRICPTCTLEIVTTNNNNNECILLNLKNRGRYVVPSTSLFKICRVAETVIRENFSVLFSKANITLYLQNVIFARLGPVFDTESMTVHISNNDVFDNHKIQLCKLIIQIYINIRLHYIAKLRSDKADNVRQKLNRIVLFKNQ